MPTPKYIPVYVFVCLLNLVFASVSCHAQFTHIAMKQGLSLGKAQLISTADEEVKNENKLVANWSTGFETEYNLDKKIAVTIGCL